MEEGGRIRPEHDKPPSSWNWPIEATSMTQQAVAVDRAQAAVAVVNEMIERRGSRPSIERSRRQGRSIQASNTSITSKRERRRWPVQRNDLEAR
jgi:hypothetical protein